VKYQLLDNAGPNFRDEYRGDDSKPSVLMFDEIMGEHFSPLARFHQASLSSCPQKPNVAVDSDRQE